MGLFPAPGGPKKSRKIQKLFGKILKHLEIWSQLFKPRSNDPQLSLRVEYFSLNHRSLVAQKTSTECPAATGPRTRGAMPSGSRAGARPAAGRAAWAAWAAWAALAAGAGAAVGPAGAGACPGMPREPKFGTPGTFY